MSTDFEPTADCPELRAHPYRRRLLSCLERHITLSLADVADELAVWEVTDPLTEIRAEDVKDIYLELYHTHLPRLEHADIVVYDQERDFVSLPGYGADAVVDIQRVDERETDSSDEGV
ncbi:DUF7344 domain-containing protein [Halegenticoccus tardaugens]|uniref:DUF7344 domain-containing protein n=1 Tax=Halegenticoccus tardaugens TaxID=2071624 RepID=UPI001E2B4FD0|nr:DNA-binding protein [Halegenticoccus tardaugens]